VRDGGPDPLDAAVAAGVVDHDQLEQLGRPVELGEPCRQVIVSSAPL
jgi:hypothetical protein